MRFTPLALSVLMLPLFAFAQENEEADVFLPDADRNTRRAWERSGWDRADVIAAEVVSIPDDPGTNAAPPTVGVRVVRVLHGDGKVDRTRAVWNARWPFEFGICGNDSRIGPWHALAFAEMPKVGEVYLFASRGDAGQPGLCSTDGNARGLLTAEFEEKALGWYRDGDKQGREYEAARAAEEKRVRVASEEFWATRNAGATLEEIFAQGDLIGVGRICSGVGYPVATFTITELLRGPNLVDGAHRVSFGTMNTPKGGERAFPDQQTSYLFVLVARGLGRPNTGTPPVYELLPGERGVLPFTDENLAAARDWARAHPLGADAEKEIVARCRIWSAARSLTPDLEYLERCLRYGDTPRPLRDQDATLTEQVTRIDATLAGLPEDTRRGALLDPAFRAAFARVLLLRAEVLALRSTGLDARDGDPENMAPVVSAAYRRIALELLDRAVAECDVTRATLEADADLKPLAGEEKWAKVLEKAEK